MSAYTVHLPIFGTASVLVEASSFDEAVRLARDTDYSRSPSNVAYETEVDVCCDLDEVAVFFHSDGQQYENQGDGWEPIP